jgi:broad specificity phosphatase PhoE
MAARHLGSRPVVAVWSSPLERALETAGVIAKRFGLPVRVEPDLVEWSMLERWAGTAWEAVDLEFPGELTAYLEHPESLRFSEETLGQLATRVRSAVERLNAIHRDGDIVIVSHQDPVQAGRIAFAGGSLSKLHEDKPRHCSIVTLRPSATWADLGMWSPEA